jgi:hypothetical protein
VKRELSGGQSALHQALCLSSRDNQGRSGGFEAGLAYGLPRLRRGAQQQDPGHPAVRLRLARRGSIYASNSHLHAAGAIARRVSIQQLGGLRLGASHHVASTVPPRRRCGLWSDSDSGASNAIKGRMSPRRRSRPLSTFIEPCLPRAADKPPAGGIGFTRSSMTASASWRGARLLVRGSLLETATISPGASRWPPQRSLLCRHAHASLTARRSSPTGTDLRCSTHPRATARPGGCPLRLRPARARRRGFASRADRNPQEYPEVTSARQARGHRVQRALHRRWRDRLPPGLRARLRGHRVEAPRLAVPLGTRRLLGKGQEPGGARGHARG